MITIWRRWKYRRYAKIGGKEGVDIGGEGWKIYFSYLFSIFFFSYIRFFLCLGHDGRKENWREQENRYN